VPHFVQDCYRVYQAVSVLPELVETLETSFAVQHRSGLCAELFCNPIKVHDVAFAIVVDDDDNNSNNNVVQRGQRPLCEASQPERPAQTITTRAPSSFSDYPF